MVHSVGRVIRGFAMYGPASLLSNRLHTLCPRIIAYRWNVLPLSASYSTKTVTKKVPAAKKATKTAPAVAAKTKNTKANGKVKVPTVSGKKKPAATKKASLTDEQKFEKKIKDVKSIALRGAPAHRPLGIWACFISEGMKGTKSTRTESSQVFGKLKEKFDAMTTPQIAELEAKRDRINKEREAAYQQWIENYTVQEIADANNARRWLKKHEVNRVTTTPLYDHRRVKRVSGPYAFFIKEQLKGNSQTEPQEGRMKAASQRWTTLTEMDKKPYIEMAAADKKRYEGEIKAQS